MVHFMYVNEIYWDLIVLHGYELKLKPKTLKNQVVMLNFGSSPFVSFEVTLNRTHDEKMTPNNSQN